MSEGGSSARALGFAVESAACDHLRAQGYRVIERNYTCRYGEIDIVAKEGSVLVFIEVRYRGRSARESPGESLSQRKIHRIRKSVKQYLFQRSIRDGVEVRVDACLAVPAESSLRERGLSDNKCAFVPGLGVVRFETIRGVVEFL